MPHRTAPGLVATYRIQLRNGVDLDSVRRHIPWFRHLGVSHLYLSPLFTAAAGSTHGYDVTDPNMVDPLLGGEEAFQALSKAARQAGLGLILDIVPNHMSLTPDNPHVAGIMREGQDSRFAQLFDIDWSRGPLHFPVLDATPDELLASGKIGLSGTPERPALRIYDADYALRRTMLSATLAEGLEPLSPDTLHRLLAEQHWRIGHWRDSAHEIAHRRFFNISSLIGVRQDDPEVFEFTHRWIVEQVRYGRIQGLRVDHIDGLARPAAYLRRLREAVGIVPIWVEKIVKETEDIPAIWPVQGMSGYEFMAPVTQLLTSPDGLAALREAASDCLPADSAQEVRTVRRELLDGMLRPELGRVARAAMEALAAGPREAAAVEAAILQLALHWPVYRSYAGDAIPPGQTLAAALDSARIDDLPSEALGMIVTLLSAPDDPLARAFAARFEQLTGALTAKSEEDTVFYRAVAYLPFCEVGASPELEPIDADLFSARMAKRAGETPCALSALSTHDTKRSADARAALIALTYLPDLGRRLYEAGKALATAHSVDRRWGIYAAQTALILYREPEREARIADHVAKAMREAKDHSSYEAPDLEAEEAVTGIAHALMERLAGYDLWSGDERQTFETAHADIVFAQLTLQICAPGIPDLYQGTEIMSSTLTDPDNRRPVDWAALPTIATPGTLDGRKLALTRELLAVRRMHRELFAMGSYRLEPSARGWILHRQWQDQHVTVEIERPVVASFVPA